MSAADTGFMLICAALVLFMTPGLAFFYGGLGRRKNVVNNILASVCTIGLETVLWVVAGFSLAFGQDHGGIIGGLEYVMMNGVGAAKAGPYAPSIPFLAYALFQMMFAIITPALVTGAVAGRMRFKSLVLFVLFWTFVVYYPVAHMVWGQGGALAAIGSVDFAGGNVVHISSGVSGLVLCIVLGRRIGYKNVNYRVHNVPLVAIGATMLLLGWFGFNAGSALAANGLAVHAFATTALSCAAAELSWMMMDVILSKKPTLVGACTGLVIGLVAITPGCGFVALWAAIPIGFVGSVICYLTCSRMKLRFGYDDASKAVNPALRWDGLLYGSASLFGAQLLSIVVTIAWAVAGTFVCVAIVRACCGGRLRVSEHEERVGLDVSEHGERAYPSFTGLDD